LSAREAGWEHFETEADVGVRAWGATRAEAFAQAALGVFALIVKPEDVAERERREVRAQGDSPERLLANWINECFYVHEIEGFVVHRVEVDACTESMVHAALHGEELDTGRHRLGTLVKAANVHRLTVAKTGGQHQVSVLVDV
jgi:tRNA nucleotidyltransferase (CCA-adding enzyme)